MASIYIIDIGINDELTTVIKKCNANFKTIMGQQSKQDQIYDSDIEKEISDAVTDLVQAIDAEAETRRLADEDLGNAIDLVRQSIPTKANMLPYVNDDLLWVINNTTVGEVMKKTDVSGYYDLIVRCVGENGNPCYTPLNLIPKDSYQNYTANGKTFKMMINTSDNNRLWWVVPNGTWELWMR